MNSVVLVGRLTKDPELRRTNSGTSVCTFTIAVDRSFKQQGQPEADFPRCLCFGKTAENLCQYMRKGSLIGVTGRIQTGSYEKNGQKVYTTDVVCDRIDYLESRKDQQQSGNQNQGYRNGGYSQNYGYPQNGYPQYQNQPQQQGTWNGNNPGQSGYGGQY